MEQITVNELQMKICHLLDNISPEHRTKAFLAAKLEKNPKTIGEQLSVLKEMGLVIIGKSATGKNHYFLRDCFRKKLDQVLLHPPLQSK